MGVASHLGLHPGAKDRWRYEIVMGCTLPTAEATTCATLLENLVTHH